MKPSEEQAHVLQQEWLFSLNSTRSALEAHLEKQDLIVQHLLSELSSANGSCRAPSKDAETSSRRQGKLSTSSSWSGLSEPSQRQSETSGYDEYELRDSEADVEKAPKRSETGVTLGQRHTSRQRVRKSSGSLSKELHQGGNGVFSYKHYYVMLHSWVQWIAHMEEPSRHGVLAKIANSKMFEALSAAVIFTNVFFTIWATNDTAGRVQAGLTAESRTQFVSEWAFGTFFLAELVLKLIVHRLYFFVNNDMGWNWLDLILVSATTANLVFTQIFSGQHT